MNKKTLIITIIAVALIIGLVAFYEAPKEDNQANTNNSQETNTQEENSESNFSKLIGCLAENDVVIYAAEWCPHCSDLVESLGGYENVEPIYVECSSEGTEEDQQRCQEESKTKYVPEIQIEGEVYEGNRNPESLADKVGCEF